MVSVARMQVTIRGKTYPNAEAAGKALGVSKQTVYAALHRERPDGVGMGQGWTGQKRCVGGKPPKPVTIGPVSFASQSEASAALGYASRNAVGDILRSGRSRARAGLLKRAMEYHMKQEQATQAAQQAVQRQAAQQAAQPPAQPQPTPVAALGPRCPVATGLE